MKPFNKIQPIPTKEKQPKSIHDNLAFYSAEIVPRRFGNPDTVIWAKDLEAPNPTYKYVINGEDTYMGGQYPGQYHVPDDDDWDNINNMRRMLKERIITAAQPNTKSKKK